MIWANSKTTANNWQNLNTGTQGVQELFFFGEFKTPGGSSTHWTLYSHNGIGCKTRKVFHLSLVGFDPGAGSCSGVCSKLVYQLYRVSC